MIAKPGETECRPVALELGQVHRTFQRLGGAFPYGCVGPDPVRLGNRTTRLVVLLKPCIGRGDAKMVGRSDGGMLAGIGGQGALRPDDRLVIPLQIQEGATQESVTAPDARMPRAAA